VSAVREVNYIDRVAIAIRQEVSPDILPEADTTSLFRLYAVLALAKGEEVTLKDVHNAWSAWMLEKDPTHKSIKPFDELSVEIQRQDQPYLNAIRRITAKKQ
jgi:hypothetical protein